MDDLAAWLDQVLKEDEARLSAPTFCGPVWPTTGQMLARIAADRQILDEHGGREVASLDPGTRGQVFIVCRRCRIGERQVVAPCTTVRLLALPHADRPGYQEAWRP